MNVLIAAGGSGGHLLPAQQLAESLEGSGAILFAGHRLDQSPFFQRERFSFCEISARSLSFSPWGFIRFALSTMRGVWQSVRAIQAFQPDVVVGFGSFHSFPILLAALLMRKKIVLFEANCLLGKVNRLFASVAHLIGAQFALKEAPFNQRLIPLLPWKEVIQIEKKQAREELGLMDCTTILIFGGSQGAAFLNAALPAVIPPCCQVIHLAGREEEALRVAASYRDRGIRAIVKAFEPNMPLVYAAVDVAICRSGASTLAELIRYEVPALFIPFPFAAGDHQRINAEFLAKQLGGAKMILEESAHPAMLETEIAQLLQERGRLRVQLSLYRNECEGRLHFAEIIKCII